MNIQITHGQSSITPAIKAMIEEKFSKLHQLYPAINTVKINISREGHRHDMNNLSYKMTADIHIPHANFFAEVTTDDLYKDIDLLKDKIKRQLKKHHDMLIDQKRHPKEDLSLEQDAPEQDED